MSALIMKNGRILLRDSQILAESFIPEFLRGLQIGLTGINSTKLLDNGNLPFVLNHTCYQKLFKRDRQYHPRILSIGEGAGLK